MNDKQIKLYSVDTKAFYTTGKQPNKNGEGYKPSEKALADVKSWANSKTKKTDKYIKKLKKNNERLKDDNENKLSDEELNNRIELAKANLTYLKNISNVANTRFQNLSSKFEGIRNLNPNYLNLKNEVALFDSELTRALAKWLKDKYEIDYEEFVEELQKKVKEDEATTNLLILRPYHYLVLNQLINNGYDYKGERYVFLTASSGQMRTKKCVFINNNFWIDTQKRLMCGLTIEDINREMGVNLNKFLAYLALSNSSTDEWTSEQGFDIDKCIVIKDFENKVNGEVDYIDVNHKVKEPIKRKLTEEERKQVNEGVIEFKNTFNEEVKEKRNKINEIVKGYREQSKADLKYDEIQNNYKEKMNSKIEKYQKTFELEIEANKDNPMKLVEIVSKVQEYKTEREKYYNKYIKKLKNKVKVKVEEYKAEDETIQKYNKKIEDINKQIKNHRETLQQDIKGYEEVCDFPITRQVMDVPIPHSDGCGWVLPTVSDKNFIVRLPWIKGLLSSCDFIKFCKTERKVDDEKLRYKITDIYGQEHDLLEENIQIIFTESQFKTWTYYKNIYVNETDKEEGKEPFIYGWEVYKACYKFYNCKANKCKVERDKKDIKNASLNYQMFQTMTDVTDEEINYFVNPINEKIINGYTDLKTMLELLGTERQKRTNLQEALRIYPEMVQDTYCKDELREQLASFKKKAKYSKFTMNAKYSFIIPDLYAWMDFTFNGVENPKGLLADGEVSCRLFKEDKLVVNRSPQLYRELPCRENVVNKDTKKWLTTNAIYISCNDLITKIIQADSDGDESVIVADPVYYEMAERNMKDIRPLYYQMAKAGKQLITNENLYKALIQGYKFSNVGQYSNKITIMWNNESIDLDTIKILTCLNNFYIDGAKSGYFPSMSADIKERIKQANGKLPYFFQFAKDKDEMQVKEINNSTVNRICSKIESRNTFIYDFSNTGKFNYETLLSNKKIDIETEQSQKIIKHYRELDKMKNKVFADSQLDKHELWYATFSYIKNEMIKKSEILEIEYSDMVDILIKDIFLNNKDTSKLTLWETFGETIIENLNNNIKKPLDDGYMMCEDCGKRVKAEKNKKFCPVCSGKRTAERNRNRKK